ncbi:MAG: translation initiation factor IF-2 [Deltaproteobacteria bacterium]|nr:translation initiation factor IF-2 [Deltaproteobacteria bacterium]
MAKRRIYDIAKEIGMSNKELVAKIRDLGYDIKNQMSTLEEVDARIVIEKLGKGGQPEPAVKKRTIIRRKKKDKEPKDTVSTQESQGTVIRRPAGTKKEDSPPALSSEKKEESQEAETIEGGEAREVPGDDVPSAATEAAVAGDGQEETVAETWTSGESADRREETSEAGESGAEISHEQETAPKETGQARQDRTPEDEAEEAREKEESQKTNAREKGKRPTKDGKGAVVIGMRKGFRQVFPSQDKGYGGGFRGGFRRGANAGNRPQPHGYKPQGVAGFGRNGSAFPGSILTQDFPLPDKVQRRKTKKDSEPPGQEETIRRKTGKKRQVLSRDDIYDITEPLQRGKRKRIATRKAKKTEITTPRESKRRIKINGTITVLEMAKTMGVKAAEVIRRLMMMGEMVTLNQSVDIDTAMLVASEFGFQVENITFDEEKVLGTHEETSEREGKPRPPVVTVMGHVDHGKTSILDKIRKSKVVDQESGGITQHIGASVVTHNNADIVFIDTPGHAAFTAMRARGAKVTDLVVLVVAADDGVMDQTVEAINHAKAAEVPIIVAVNKMDLPGANVDRIKQNLTEYDLVCEEWGGDTLVVPVSAKTGMGLDDLLEAILLQSEILELKADPDTRARGVVIDAKLDKGRGPAATLLIQEGTLHKGDYLVAGYHFGKVRALLDHMGKQLGEAGPSTPVEVLGLSGVPVAGEDANVVANEKDAKKLVDFRKQKAREEELARSRPIRQILFGDEAAGPAELNLLIKGDVQGSVEALREALLRLSTDEVAVKVIHEGVGAVSENDINLAQASEALVLGFRVRPDAKAVKQAEESKIELLLFNVIYEAIDAVKKLMAGQLEPEHRENILGRAEVREVFNIPKVGVIAGSYILDGKVARGARARLLRDNVVIHQGKIGSLRRFKDDAREVTAGYECGIGLENYNDVQVNDIIEAFEIQDIAREI